MLIKLFEWTLHGMCGMLKKDGVEFKQMILFCQYMYF